MNTPLQPLLAVLQWRPHLDPLLCGLVIVGAGVWLWFVYQRMLRRLTPRKARLLLAPKALITVLLLLALFEPVSSIETKEATRGKLLALLDTSSSMDVPDDGHDPRLARGRRILARLKKDLPAGTMFPTMHTLAIINAAREGKKFLSIPLFDGTDKHGVEDSSIAIVDWKPPFETKYTQLTPLPSTRVRLAFFDRAAAEVTPSYEVAMRYWENGIADNMAMDFGDFVMLARLTDLAPLPRRC